ncbi:MAG: acyl-ACP--UDP-N-acetylglucosamine O-acyltransferase [Planctomycetota bacterium]|jgi:UDP-N-acetylglucosamine acyltransferase
MAKIHPTAIVHPSACLAESVEVGPYCVIGPDVTIGEETLLHNHVTVQSYTVIGKGNQFYPFSVVGADPQDRKYYGERALCEIGDNNKIREHVTIHRGTKNGGGVTRIGSDNLIMVSAHIAHDCILEHDITIANQVMLAGHVRVEEGANIGGGTGVHHFTRIGTCAFVGGLCRIAKDVPPYMIVEGNPAEVRAINTIAMSRRDFLPEHIEAVKDAHRRLYRVNGAAMAEKLTDLQRDYPDVPAIQQLCRFLEASAGGVHGRALEVARPDDKRKVVA